MNENELIRRIEAYDKAELERSTQPQDASTSEQNRVWLLCHKTTNDLKEALKVFGPVVFEYSCYSLMAPHVEYSSILKIPNLRIVFRGGK